MTLAAAGLALLGALLAVALGLGGFMAFSMFLPSRGRPIRREARPRRALLILDLQEGYVGAGTRRPVMDLPSTGLFGAVNRLVAWAEAGGVEVGYVTQVFAFAWLVRLHGGRAGSRVVVDRRVRLVNGNVFEKRRTDAFSSRSLEAWLEERGVGEVILAGVDAAYCVTMTARGALSRGYAVTVASDAVASRHPLGPVLDRLAARGVRVAGSGEIAGSSSLSIPE